MITMTKFLEEFMVSRLRTWEGIKEFGGLWRLAWGQLRLPGQRYGGLEPSRSFSMAMTGDIFYLISNKVQFWVKRILMKD